MEKPTQFFKKASKEEEWLNSNKGSEDDNLELRLGPPGVRLWLSRDNDENTCKVYSFHYEEPVEKVLLPSLWFSGTLQSSTFQCRETQKELQQPEGSCLQYSAIEMLKCPEKDSPSGASFPATAVGTNAYNKRVAAGPVVGWPPIRSFRKKLSTSSTSKLASRFPDRTPREWGNEKPESRSDLFVKINMEGVPIGRKINLNAYDSYEKLSIAIKELFSGLVAASRETAAVREENLPKNETKANEGAATRNEEYTLVYEDNEGDRILVGDVPWQMFVSTAKRLRVLKSSDLPIPLFRSGEQKRKPVIGTVADM